MQIRAAVSRKGHSTPVVECVELGELGEHDILVRIVACGICRTDVDADVGSIRVPKPIVLGHEGAGIVEAVGAGVGSLQVGDHVVLSGSSCGQCRNCDRGLPSYCRDTMRRNFSGLRPDGKTYIESNGSRVFGHFFGQSSFAQYAMAHERAAVKVPDDLSLAVLAPLGCSLATGAGAVFNALDAACDDTIAIFGVGAVGLAAVMAARIVGMKRIIVVDRAAERLELAVELGATEALESSKATAAQGVRDICPDGVDLSLNTTNSAEMLSAAVHCLAIRGVSGFVSAPHEAWTAPVQTMLSGGRTLKAILGSDARPQEIVARLIEHYRSGRFPIERLLTYYPFEDIQQAFADFAAGRAVKPVLLL